VKIVNLVFFFFSFFYDDWGIPTRNECSFFYVSRAGDDMATVMMTCLADNCSVSLDLVTTLVGDGNALTR
jgi:hypothetical protein